MLCFIIITRQQMPINHWTQARLQNRIHSSFWSASNTYGWQRSRKWKLWQWKLTQTSAFGPMTILEYRSTISGARKMGVVLRFTCIPSHNSRSEMHKNQKENTFQSRRSINHLTHHSTNIAYQMRINILWRWSMTKMNKYFSMSWMLTEVSAADFNNWALIVLQTLIIELW